MKEADIERILERAKEKYPRAKPRIDSRRSQCTRYRLHPSSTVGNATTCDNNAGYWSNTVILITWDDWGGFYDHVSPDFPSGPGIGYSTGQSTQYVYGFRVPLLVVSRYTKQTTGVPGYTGYVSGPRDSHTCDDTNYCHDFGSILNFIEYAFGANGQYKGTIGDQHSAYADALAPDASPTCPLGICPYSLSDFFNFNQPHNFVPITGWKYAETCFHNPNQTGCWPNTADEDPDNDAFEE